MSVSARKAGSQVKCPKCQASIQVPQPDDAAAQLAMRKAAKTEGSSPPDVDLSELIVYDDVANQDKIRIFDARVETPPHYDTFAEFHYAYHYGDMYSPYVKQDEPLKTECQHFADCIRTGKTPLTDGVKGLEVVRILEASSESLKLQGAPIQLSPGAKPPRVEPKHDANTGSRSPLSPLHTSTIGKP